MGIILQDAVNAAFAAIEAEKAALTSQIADLQHQAELLLASANKANADLATAQQTITAKNAEIARLEARIRELEAGNPGPTPEPEQPNPPAPPTGEFWQGLKTVWPTAATTGPRIPLTAESGTSKSGTVKGKSLAGGQRPANNTVYEDCEIRGGLWGVDASGRTGVKLINCRLIGDGGEAGVLGNVEIINTDISGYKDGFKPQGAGWVFRGNYVHDLYAGAGAHNDGLQAHDGPGIIERNYIKARDTSAVMIQSFASGSTPPKGIIVRENWLGGADLPLRIEDECKGRGCEAYNNVIEKGHWGHYDLSGADRNSGNIDSVTGKAI